MIIILSIIGVSLFILISFMFFLVLLILVKMDNNILELERKVERYNIAKCPRPLRIRAETSQQILRRINENLSL